MGCVEQWIRSCWEYYAYDDAIVLAELNFAQKLTDHAAFLLATSYFRSGQYSSAYEFLKNFGTRTPEAKFLFARCCEQMNKLIEAEETLSEQETQATRKQDDVLDNEFGQAAPYAHALLGRIYGKTNRTNQAISEHRAALTNMPALFESFKALRNLGATDDSSQYFYLQPVSARSEVSLRMTETWTAPSCVTSCSCVPFADCEPGSNVTPEINVSSIETSSIISVPPPQLPPPPPPPPPTEQYSNNSSDCKTPYLNSNSSGTEMNLVPKAPTKNPSRRAHLDNNCNGSRVVTRQQSQRLLTQNQSKITTRRGARLFESSVKENENEVVSVRRDKTNVAKISVMKKAARSRKTDLEKLTANNNELNKTKGSFQTRAGAENVTSVNSAGNDDKKHDNATVCDEDCFFLNKLQKLADVESTLSSYDCRLAVVLAQNMAECHSSSPLGLLALARGYFEQADYQKAVECFGEMRRRFGYSVKGMEYYSTALWHLQREMELSALAQELTEQHKFAPESWCSAGNCFSLQKDHDTAIRFFQRAIQVNPDFAYAYTLLGHEYVAIEAYEQALQSFRVALRLQPRHYNAWYGIGLIYYKQEKLGLARLHLRRALEINPSNSVLMCHVSLVQQALEDKKGAMKLLDDALFISPHNTLCRYHRAHLLFAHDRLEDALTELKELKQLAPKEPMVYFLAGKVHKKMGQPHLALMNFSWATELDPRGEQHYPVVGERRYDEEPVTALATMGGFLCGRKSLATQMADQIIQRIFNTAQYSIRKPISWRHPDDTSDIHAMDSDYSS